MKKYNLNLLIIIIIIGFTVIISGCTSGQDVTSVVKALPEVQQFLNEHPNAKITVTFWSKEEIAKSVEDIGQQCGKPITPVAMYKAIISEGDLTIISWINADDQILLCSLTQGKGSQTTPTTTATATQTTTANAAPTTTVTATTISTLTPTTTVTATTTPTLTPTITPTGKNGVATIVTDKGTIKFELFEKDTPITTKNFIDLAQSGFYNSLTFHRVEPGFVIQTGDPKGDGTGGSDKTIPLEIAPGLTHKKGAVGMARAQDPNSASSQFYICLGDAKFLDGSYAVFGQVIEGQDVAENIRIGDKMLNVTIMRI